MVRPAFLAARSFQRTTYRPGEVGQVDRWHTGAQIPVGAGRTREAVALVVSLPHAGAHAAVFSFNRTVADATAGILGCLERLGGVPEALVFDHDDQPPRARSNARSAIWKRAACRFGPSRRSTIAGSSTTSGRRGLRPPGRCGGPEPVSPTPRPSNEASGIRFPIHGRTSPSISKPERASTAACGSIQRTTRFRRRVQTAE